MPSITIHLQLATAAALVAGVAALDLGLASPAPVPLYAAGAWIAWVPGRRRWRYLPLLAAGLTCLACLVVGAILDGSGHVPHWPLRATTVALALLPALLLRGGAGVGASSADVYRTRYEFAPVPMTEEDWSAARRHLDAMAAAGITDLRAHFDRHPDVVRELAGMAVIRDVNPAAVAAYRAPSRQALIDSFNDTAGYDGAGPSAEIFKTVLCGLYAGQHVVTAEGPDVTFSGERMHLRSSTIAVPGTAEPWGFIMQTVEDITEMKVTERRLRVARDEAEWANAAKSEFLAAMSHEMRTPLNAIIGFASIMADEMMGAMQNPRYREYASDINDSGRHLLRLVSDLLDVSKIEAGELVLQSEDVALEQVLRASLRLIAGQARGAGIELETDVAAALPTVPGDERRLRQIMINLLSNALKFTPRGGKVTVSLARVGDVVCFVVRDTGIGIAPDDLQRVTRPFVQSATYLAQHADGTGLGLALTQSLVEMHGGTMAIDSRLGRGTTVTIRLPLQTPASGA